MVTRWLPLLALLLAADEPREAANPREADRIYPLFQHTVHEKPLEKEGITCAGCHQVGALPQPGWTEEQADALLLRPPEGACHYCHAPGEGELGGKGASVRAAAGPGFCGGCHESVEAPADHGPGWLDIHGTEARLAFRDCTTCHRPTFCTTCHDRRETARGRVHDPTWLGLHGIAVRADPASCGTCHLQADCIACHTSGSGFGR